MGYRRIWFLIAAVTLPSWSYGGTPDARVLPWMGHRAAATLAFDGGRPGLLDTALPVLDRRGMKATFFMVANRIERKDDWRKALSSGHEIGSETLDGSRPSGLTQGTEEGQVVGARNVLQKEFGVPVLTFAYPFGMVTPGLKHWAEKEHLLALAGEGQDRPLGRGAAPDWWEIPSRNLSNGTSVRVGNKWVDGALRDGGWSIWRVRGIGDGADGELTPVRLSKFLDQLSGRDIWVGTFLEVGSYLRARSIFNDAVPVEVPDGKKWEWNLPDVFPAKVALLVEVPASKAPSWKGGVWQGKIRVLPDGNGDYTIDFDAKELEVYPEGK